MLHSFSCLRPASPNDTEGQVARPRRRGDGVFCWNLAGLRSVKCGLAYFQGNQVLNVALVLKRFLVLCAWFCSMMIKVPLRFAKILNLTLI